MADRPSASDISVRLTGRAEDLCRELLPGGRREGADLFPPDRLVLERKTVALHERGVRIVAEFLVELIAAHPEIRADVHALLDRFLRLPPDMYAALNADKLPPAPLHEVAS